MGGSPRPELLKYASLSKCALALGLLACAGPSAAHDAGGGLDAGPPSTSASDAGMDAGTAPDAAVDPATLLRAQIRALRALLDGQLPTALDPQSLFEADLLDADARSARIRVLEQALRPSSPDDAGPPDAALDDGALDGSSPDAAFLDGAADDDGGAPDASAAPPHRPPPSSPAPRSLDGGPPDGGPPDGGPPADAPDAGPPEAAGELATLERERDRLRLAFLRLPTAEQTRVAEAVRARRRIAIEERASRVDAERATRDAERATAASDDLFDQAAGSADALQSALLSERARIEATRADLARWEVRFARRRQAEARAGADRLQRFHGFESRLPTIDPAGADALYDEVVGLLVVQRERLRAAIDELDAPSGVPVFELRIDLVSAPYRGLEETGELRTAAAALDHEVGRAAAEEERLRWQWTERVATDLRRLDGVRVSLLPRMSSRRRAAVLGLGAEGRGQLGRELDQIATMSRWWLRQTWHDLTSYPLSLVAIAASPNTRVELTLAVFLALLIGLIWQQRESITAWLRRSVHAPKSARPWVALVRPFWAAIGPVVVPLILLVAFYGLAGLIDTLTESLFFDVLRAIVVRVAWFYVLVTMATGFFVSRLRHGASRAAVARRILGSVRLVLGFGLVVLLITDLSELLVGHGYIYGIVVDLAWLGAAPIGVILIRHWKDEVVEAHQRRWVEGFVARALRRSDERWRRYLLTPFAAAQLAASGGWATLKELALRFEQLRRAFAFLFRRRLERRIEATLDESHIDALSSGVRDAFREVPTDPDLEIDRFPRLEEIVERVRAALDPNEPGFVFALVGERGIGKTTWLRELRRRVNAEVHLLDVPHRLVEPAHVCRWLSEQLELPPTDSIDDLAAALDGLEKPKVVILDHCQNLVVRAIGGTEGLEGFVELAAKTGRNVVWVCSFAHYTWRYLECVRQGQNLFRDHIVLDAWSDEEIACLIRHRMARAGLHASFRDLVVDPVAGTALADAILHTEEEYLRLLWDFASGNPRVALHFWKHSLVEAGASLKVRLFAAPDIDALDALHDQSRFLLATIALHENATVVEAAQSAGSSPRECSALLAYLQDCGYVDVDACGNWRLSTHWYRCVIRHLRRQRLLFD